MTSFWCLYGSLWTCFTPFSYAVSIITPFFGVSINDLEQVIVCWERVAKNLEKTKRFGQTDFKNLSRLET